MAEKVKVSQETAKALETALDRGSKETLLIYHCNGFTDEGKLQDGSVWTQQEYIGLNELSPEQLAVALYVGYEIEQTPGEKVKNYFNSWNQPIDGISNSDWTSEQKAIIGTLNRLNIKIKGINE